MKSLFTRILVASMFVFGTWAGLRTIETAASDSADQTDSSEFVEAESDADSWSKVDLDESSAPISALRPVNYSLPQWLEPVGLKAFRRSRHDAFSELHKNLTMGFTRQNFLRDRRTRPWPDDPILIANKSYFLMIDFPTGTLFQPAEILIDNDFHTTPGLPDESNSIFNNRYDFYSFFRRQFKLAYGISRTPSDESTSIVDSLYSHTPKTRWKLDQAELIGVIKQTKPVAYVSGQLPQNQAHANGPTRALSAFEERAIVQLQLNSSKAIEISESDDEIQFVAPLVYGCAGCHRDVDDERALSGSQLFGAMTYRFRRVKEDDYVRGRRGAAITNDFTSFFR